MNNFPEWISVNDRLPKGDGDDEIFCLVCDKDGSILVLPFCEHYDCWNDAENDDYYTDAVGGNVTHWMPLPEPPKQ